MIDEWREGFAALGLKFANVIVGAVMSFISLTFWKGMESRSARWTTFIGGWTLAAWGAEPLREWLELKPSLEIGLVIALAMFGMAIAAEIIKLIRDTDWKGLATSIIRRRTGGDDKGGVP